jgi:RNA polymerase sigma-70 factor, ECF subfamily
MPVETQAAPGPPLVGALVEEARNGCSAAIEELVTRYEGRLFRMAQNITSNYEDAEEVVQNAFIKAFQKLDSFQGDSRFYTWLVRIGLNEALMKIRGVGRFRKVSIDVPQETQDHLIPRELEDWGPNPEERYSQEELTAILHRSIRELDPGCRIVFQFRDVEGLSIQETARALGLSPTAVKSRLRRARLRLRDALHVYFRPARRAYSPTSREEINCGEAERDAAFYARDRKASLTRGEFLRSERDLH